jgi:hypothetical protein
LGISGGRRLRHERHVPMISGTIRGGRTGVRQVASDSEKGLVGLGVRLRKSPDTIQSLTVANIRSGPTRFRSSPLRNSPDKSHILPKSHDTVNTSADAATQPIFMN